MGHCVLKCQQYVNNFTTNDITINHPSAPMLSVLNKEQPTDAQSDTDRGEIGKQK